MTDSSYMLSETRDKKLAVDKKSSDTPLVSEEETVEAEENQESEAVAKLRKNERERQRRLAMSDGFDQLSSVLNLGRSQQHDKVSILVRLL